MEIKRDRYTILEISDSEFQQRMEQEKRECLPCMYIVATAADGNQYPAIMLKNRIKNKKAYLDTTVDSWWYLMQDRTKSIKLLILKLDFRGAGTMKFIFDLNPGDLNKNNRDEIFLWMQFLLLSEGTIAVPDGIGPSIGATGITLEIPKMLLTGEL